MSEHHEMSKTTPKDFVLALLGGLFAPGLAIVLIVLLAIGIQKSQVDAEAADISDKAVRERIQTFGVSHAVDPKAPKVERTGEQVYNEVCSSCHASGALESPKFKDAAAWGKRLGQGYDTLLTHALKGIRKMPARGGEPDLTDLEVARGMVHMANAAGAKFEAVLQKEKVPSAAELARGKTVYAENCAECHNTGLTGAQKLNDSEAWVGLIKQGKDTSTRRGSSFAEYKGQRKLGTWGHVGTYSFNMFSSSPPARAAWPSPTMIPSQMRSTSASSSARARKCSRPTTALTEFQAAVGVAQLKKVPGYLGPYTEGSRLLDEAVADCDWLNARTALDESVVAPYFWSCLFHGERAGVDYAVFKAALRQAGGGFGTGFLQVPAYMYAIFRNPNAYGDKGCPYNCHLYIVGC